MNVYLGIVSWQMKEEKEREKRVEPAEATPDLSPSPRLQEIPLNTYREVYYEKIG